VHLATWQYECEMLVSMQLFQSQCEIANSVRIVLCRGICAGDCHIGTCAGRSEQPYIVVLMYVV